MAVEEAPDRARGEVRAVLAPEHLREFDERDVHLGLHRAENGGSIRCERWSPPLGRAFVAPIVWNTRTQRMVVATPTPKRSVTARRDSLPSTASTTRLRRSSDKVRPMQAGFLTSQQGESDRRCVEQEHLNPIARITL